ncbi:hypothetical protein QKU_3367 [Clostridioides difficile DA00203]|nr:hypothetical protein QKU_3367 [Clostridioides difficile DA00203]EQH16568.1 hypothetical protein QKO_0287 [Clostridioides difficile DA00195]EQI35065.1 hypothetical protein QOW_1582 [Clostridioides difficile Y215]EQI64267.1 hypothetical protein QQC_3290 [Clostridioides difficile Y358]EQJ32288.1 hypothetical protein QS7_0805 [Clostridioides difficile P19]EQJ33296.1 hypothetical protein QS9_3194 [Clostridioides difficile P20]OMK54790.1 hypothetical protein BER45_000352 [Clostridioides difficil
MFIVVRNVERKLIRKINSGGINMQKDVWLYSWDDEYFASDEYESKEEAIQGAKEELREFGEFSRLVYVGQKEEVDIPNIDAEDALELVQGRIDNEFGGYGEDWFENIRAEDIVILENRISKVFKKWIDEFGYKPYWFVVRDTEEIELNEVANES